MRYSAAAIKASELNQASQGGNLRRLSLSVMALNTVHSRTANTNGTNKGRPTTSRPITTAALTSQFAIGALSIFIVDHSLKFSALLTSPVQGQKSDVAVTR